MFDGLGDQSLPTAVIPVLEFYLHVGDCSSDRRVDLDGPSLNLLQVHTVDQVVAEVVVADLPHEGGTAAEAGVGDGDVGGGAAGGPDELGRAPLELLPGGVLVRVHLALGDADGRHELPPRRAEAAHQGWGLVREVHPIVKVLFLLFFYWPCYRWRLRFFRHPGPFCRCFIFRGFFLGPAPCPLDGSGRRGIGGFLLPASASGFGGFSISSVVNEGGSPGCRLPLKRFRNAGWGENGEGKGIPIWKLVEQFAIRIESPTR